MVTVLMNEAERATAGRWVNEALGGSPPFSFRYDGTPSDQFLSQWTARRETAPGENGTVLHRVVYKDPVTGLECSLEMTCYDESPAAEWLVRLRNTGGNDTPIIEDIQALDMVRDCPSETLRPCLHYSKGTDASIDDFMPQSKDLTRNPEVTLSGTGGPSRQVLPFFNLELDAQGVIIAIGWTGLWACSFVRGKDRAIRIRAGMEKTHLRLHPGEEIRTPRVLLLFWQGDILNGHNMLRRLLVQHHLPRPGGRPVDAPLCNSTWGGMKTGNHLKTIEFIRDHDLGFDAYWIDAGWYGPDHETEEFQNFFTEDWAYHIGHWRVNRLVHPQGLKPISDAAHAAGMKLLLWFNPYMAVYGSPVTLAHPEWIMGDRVWPSVGLSQRPIRACALNIGIPEARRWLTEQISGLIAEHGVDCYRDDGSSFTPDFWRANDEPDRQGITEIRCVEGLYDHWDDLLRRHPGLLIDNCGGGGTRIDLETIGRSLVLHRTDYYCDPGADSIAGQVGAYGLAYWVPLVGGALPAHPGDTYNLRSSLSGGMAFSLYHPCGFGEAATGPADGYPVEWHRRMATHYRRSRESYKGDFYPLTGCSVSPKDWLAYQMHRDDLGEGIVVAFRRPESPLVSAQFRLQGLDPSADYEVENADTGEISRFTGRSLAENGVAVTMNAAPASCLLFYTKVPSATPARS